jgi:hypothetical protein
MAIHISPQNSDTVDEYNMPKQVAIPVRKGVLKLGLISGSISLVSSLVQIPAKPQCFAALLPHQHLIPTSSTMFMKQTKNLRP